VIVVLSLFLNPFGNKSISPVSLPSHLKPTISLESVHQSGLNISIAYNAVVDKVSRLNLSASTINWGDGTTTPLYNTNHTYSKYQNYTINITAYDTSGAKDSTSLKFSLQPKTNGRIPAPSVIFYTRTNGFEVNVNGTANPFPSQDIAGAKITQVYINWGDGNITNGFVQASHTYSEVGSYPISVTALDSFGNSNTVSKTVFVSGQSAPQLQYSAICPSIPPTLLLKPSKIMGYSVELVGTLGPSVIGGTINWGDGNTTILTDYTHTYLRSGSYPIQIVVYDSCDRKSSYRLNVNLTAPSTPPKIGMDTPVISGYRVKISANITTASNANIDWSRTAINWGDGNTTLAAVSYTHTYSRPNNYTVVLTVVDTLGDKNTAFATFSVPEVPPGTHFVPPPLNIIHVGQNLSSGEFNVFLKNITSPDKNGNSKAALAIYSDNSFVAQKSIPELSSAEINVSGKILWIYIGRTYTNVARENWTEIQLLSG
ncbi:MAG: hypothetical protein KGH54_03220, partial [Candidatus Micrarchaeota archaeon]|nr:hypothetical protein [Candidatus Micrarchaeota archaeon]